MIAIVEDECPKFMKNRSSKRLMKILGLVSIIFTLVIVFQLQGKLNRYLRIREFIDAVKTRNERKLEALLAKGVDADTRVNNTNFHPYALETWRRALYPTPNKNLTTALQWLIQESPGSSRLPISVMWSHSDALRRLPSVSAMIFFLRLFL